MSYLHSEIIQCFQQMLCAFESVYSGFYTKISGTFLLEKVHAVLFLAFYFKTESVLSLLFFSWIHMLVFTTEIFSSTEMNITEV